MDLEVEFLWGRAFSFVMWAGDFSLDLAASALANSLSCLLQLREEMPNDGGWPTLSHPSSRQLISSGGDNPAAGDRGSRFAVALNLWVAHPLRRCV